MGMGCDEGVDPFAVSEKEKNENENEALALAHAQGSGAQCSWGCGGRCHVRCDRVVHVVDYNITLHFLFDID